MADAKEIVIRRSVGSEDFVEIPGSIVLEEGAFYVHFENTDLAISLEPVLGLLKETLMEVWK